ncbi:MAG TPA: 5-formyltetrahydrofolate cyclo-ligase [Campylobacterales bacterium]|nr:5-formyltetrahydrofolate cyclo-ligase [Campylobacterales bacterium]
MSKELFRKRAIQRLKALSPQQRRIYSYKVNQKLELLLNLLKPKSILFYLPLKFEPDIYPLLKKFRKKGVDIYIPFIEGDTFKMVKFRLPLFRSGFGTLESGNSKMKIKRVDIVIVPVIGIDRSFRRIGLGKGMYDRFFQNLPKRPITIFTQNLECISKTTITENHDIRADYYITPKTKDMKRDVNRNFNRSNSIGYPISYLHPLSRTFCN